MLTVLNFFFEYFLFFLYGRCCSFLGLTIFNGPYCWLFDCSYFDSIIIMIIIIIRAIFTQGNLVNIMSIVINKALSEN